MRISLTQFLGGVILALMLFLSAYWLPKTLARFIYPTHQVNVLTPSQAQVI